MSSSTNEFSKFNFNFRQINIDGLFSEDEKSRMVCWMEQSRELLIKILSREQIQVLRIWYNIYHGVYERLTSSMGTSRCLELLHAAAPTDEIDPCKTLIKIISSFDISIPHPRSLNHPVNSKYCIPGLGQRVFDFDNDYACAKVIDKIPTILINHQIFDINRPKYDSTDVITEPNGILFLAIVIAHEITHGMNLARTINDPNVNDYGTPKLMIFKSYSPSGEIDAGNFVERLMLDGELNLSKEPPTPMLFLIVGRDGAQVTLTDDVIKACIHESSFNAIMALINTTGNRNGSEVVGTNAKKGSPAKLSPLFHFQHPTQNMSLLSSPILILTPMLQSK